MAHLNKITDLKKAYCTIQLANLNYQKQGLRVHNLN